MPSSGSVGGGRKSRVGSPGPGRVGWRTWVLSGSGREKEREERKKKLGSEKKTEDPYLFNLNIPEKSQLPQTITSTYDVRFTRATCLRTHIDELYNFHEGSFRR